MKAILFTWCLFLSLTGLAVVRNDTTDVIKISKLPRNGLVLKQGWKFTSSNNSEYAKSWLVNQGWQSIDPTLPLPDLPIEAQSGAGWLRVNLSIAPNLRRNAAVIIAQQSAAIEIYLNGRLIGRRGIIEKNGNSGRGYIDMQPITLPVTNDAVQYLAIHYVHEKRLRLIDAHLSLPILPIRFVNIPEIINFNDDNKIIQFAALTGFSVLLLLSIIHYVLYLYNSKARGNLYFALYAGFFALYTGLGVSRFVPQPSQLLIFIALINNYIYDISSLFLIKALLTVFNFNYGRYFYLLLALFVVELVLFTFITSLYIYAYCFAVALISVPQFFLIVKAIFKKKRGAVIISTGFILGVVGMICFTYITATYQSFPQAPYVISICLASLCPAIGISIYLGREFALDGSLLRVKLDEVEQLFKENSEQRIEKEALLSHQNELLELQVAKRTSELSRSLNDLKNAQNQLIQSEKMASLGELTAGIAHEIQNPLNFVNNFSEVNAEMIEELKEELKSGNNDEALSIAEDIGENEKKIRHHGKRADSIVKGMLEHSRAGSRQKEATDINALADEYLRLAFHGLRAKDKEFNADLLIYLDKGIPKINVIPQDIGRVLLNLFNNAFYAVNQKSKTSEAEYKPEVSVTTSAEKDSLVIKVKDNGNGIPDAIKDKIMQPFFTTKPAGEGTGLGLSLTYDMVVKGHGGSIMVDTKEGLGSEFIISLPINK